jgi:transglutaminase-like putative cysteine protease
VPQLPTGTFILPRTETVGSNEEQTIHYEVLMEPMGNNVFFLAPRARTVAGNYRMIETDGDDAVFNLDLEHPVERYEATSNISPSFTSESGDAANVEGAKRYLRVPSLDSRIPLLAERVGSISPDSFGKALAIEEYLRTKFGYTLELPRTVQPDPLANFLFERKQGHCEYFASAMAVMLRTQGIPSRVVNGFRGGEFNDVSSQYVVRASNAHSWVEAYFPGRGWVSFDPTPAGPGEMHTGWSRLLLYVDAAASFWREWVISYDVGHQRLLGQEARRSSRQMLLEMQHWARGKYASIMMMVRRTSRRMAHEPVGWTLGGILSAGLLLLLAASGKLWRMLRTWRLANSPDRSPSAAATIWYQRMLRKAAKQGWRKSPVQTPAEFVTSIEDETMRARVAAFTRRYESARFGNSLEDANRLPELYEQFCSPVDR